MPLKSCCCESPRLCRALDDRRSGLRPGDPADSRSSYSPAQPDRTSGPIPTPTGSTSTAAWIAMSRVREPPLHWGSPGPIGRADRHRRDPTALSELGSRHRACGLALHEHRAGIQRAANFCIGSPGSDSPCDRTTSQDSPLLAAMPTRRVVNSSSKSASWFSPTPSRNERATKS
jgi:hypothetical protein